MKRIIAAVLTVLLLVASTFSLTSCWFGGDYTPEPGAGERAAEPPPQRTGSPADTSSDTDSAEPATPADTADSDDDELDIFGD